MLDKNLTIDGDSQSFENPRKHNNSAIVPSTHILLVSDTLQCQHKNTTRITRPKLSPYGNAYICFQTDRKTSRKSKFVKSRALTKYIDSIFFCWNI